jgi:hydroxymethylglutaryl-CoA lyase
MRRANGQRLYVQEVSARDGLQIEPIFVPTPRKIAFIDRLSRTGLAKIEVTSFVSPRAIPALADAEDVMRAIERVPGVVYSALVPNQRGAERALGCRVDEVNLVMSASETHNLANLRMTRAKSLEQFGDIVRTLEGSGIAINVSLSTTFGCPFEGDVPESGVFDLIERFVAMNIGGVSLCDTTGMANPAQVERLSRAAKERWPPVQFTAHFHNTRAMGLANALAAIEAGIDRFDASLGGLGGCPYAPGASGNICTEDLVHMLEAMGYETGVNLDELLAIAHTLPTMVGHDVPGQVVKAGPSSRRYAAPDWIASGDEQSRLSG